MSLEKKQLENLRSKIVGKELKQIIYLNIDEILRGWLNVQLDQDYHHDVDMAQVLVFEDRFLLFVDFDCDGYRSGDWHIKQYKQFAKTFLDKGYTQEIKVINGIVKDVEFYQETTSLEDTPGGYYSNDSEFLLIETNNYVIQMGQRNVSDYYPSNFFCVEDIKNLILQKEWRKKKNE